MPEDGSAHPSPPREPTDDRPELRHTTRLGIGATYAVAWFALAVVASLGVFLQSSRTITLASHDAILRPDLSGQVVLHTGPVLPDFRIDSGSPVGVDIRLGKTDAVSTDALIDRYAFIASQPEGQTTKLSRALRDMAFDAVVRGTILGLIPILVWVLIGSARRRELARRVRSRRGAASGLLALLIVVGFWEPWSPDEDTVDAEREWMSLASFLGPEVHLPEEVRGVEVRGDVTTSQTRRLIASAIDTYDKSKTFYAAAALNAAGLDLHQPEEGDTVVALISDRHDNIGMDAVARAVADVGGASSVFGAGDDTSSGQTWEAFSLDSVTAAFDGLDRWAVAGNHDNGSFVRGYLDDRGWTMLDGHVVDGPGGSTLLGVDDPRSSGLGSWRDETGLSFDEVGARLSDVACDSDERISTMLVHDADLAKQALDRGCVDLVLGGHLHEQVGPTRVVGENGQAGYTYTTGTTGGAAYAIAVGSKIRRTAEISLVTYRDGRPVGIQPILLQTNGIFDVGDYLRLFLTDSDAESTPGAAQK